MAALRASVRDCSARRIVSASAFFSERALAREPSASFTPSVAFVTASRAFSTSLSVDRLSFMLIGEVPDANALAAASEASCTACPAAVSLPISSRSTSA